MRVRSKISLAKIILDGAAASVNFRAILRRSERSIQRKTALTELLQRRLQVAIWFLVRVRNVGQFKLKPIIVITLTLST